MGKATVKKSTKSKAAPVDVEVETEAELADTLDEIDALMATDEVEVVIETPEELDKLEASIDAESKKLEAYEEQEEDKTSEVKPKAASKEKPKKAVKRIKFDSVFDHIEHKLGEKAGDYFVLEAGDEKLSDIQRSDKVRTAVDSMAKKVGEKAVNLFDHVAGGRELSSYTKVGLSVLKNTKGPINAKLIFEEMKRDDNVAGRSYSDGTARSQSHQMTQLFNTLKITQPAGKGIERNPDSVLADLLLG